MCDATDRPAWDEIAASKLLNKIVLIGITRVASDGTQSLEQMHGEVIYAASDAGVKIELRGIRQGETFWLPPDSRSFFPAAAGEYRLRSTGEIVINPDFTSSWTINDPVQ